MLVFGIVLTFVYSVIILAYDDEMPSFKMCTHQSKEDFRDIILKALEDLGKKSPPPLSSAPAIIESKGFVMIIM